jgi:hypothetical protein
MPMQCTEIWLGAFQPCHEWAVPYIRMFETYRGIFTRLVRPSRAKFRVFTNWCMQVGHWRTFCLHISQIVLPFAHNLIGGLMFSKHTGYSGESTGFILYQSIQTACWRRLEYRDSRIQSVTYVSENIVNCMGSVYTAVSLHIVVL